MRRVTVDGDSRIPNEIKGFYHCKKCIEEATKIAARAGSASPRHYAKLEFGVTKSGFQLFCVRHEINVMKIEISLEESPNES